MSMRKRFEPIMQPRIAFSRSTMSAAGSSTFVPTGTTPIMTIVAALARHPHRLTDGRWVADRLERDVDAARRHRDDRRHRVAVGGVHNVGRAETRREVELPRHGVDGDDLGGAGDAASLHHRETDTAAADDDDRLP